jgi:hypothetical protein
MLMNEIDPRLFGNATQKNLNIQKSGNTESKHVQIIADEMDLMSYR